MKTLNEMVAILGEEMFDHYMTDTRKSIVLEKIEFAVMIYEIPKKEFIEKVILVFNKYKSGELKQK